LTVGVSALCSIWTFATLTLEQPLSERSGHSAIGLTENNSAKADHRLAVKSGGNAITRRDTGYKYCKEQSAADQRLYADAEEPAKIRCIGLWRDA
jgi:hypothetical protein